MLSINRLMASSALAFLFCTPAFAQETPPAPQPVPAAAEPAKPEASPLLPSIRQRLTSPAHKGAEEQDRAALVSFYDAPDRAPIWVGASGLTPRAIALIAEMKASADWGLTPASYETPDTQVALATPDALADAEVRIGLAALKYARHARGGRVDVSLLGRNVDQKPPILDPKVVVDGLAASPDAAAYLRGLHPRHPQFEKLRQALLAMRKPQAAATEAAVPGSDVKLPAGPRIKPGQSHAQVALLRQRLNVPGAAGQTQRLDDELKAALIAFQESKGS